jgi:tetratricopeptide (TPR) repeat protein
MRTQLILATAMAFVQVVMAQDPGASAAAKASREVVKQAPVEKDKQKSVPVAPGSKVRVAPKYAETVAAYQIKAQAAHQVGDHKLEATAAFNAGRASESLGTIDASKLAGAENSYRQSIQAAAEASDITQKNLSTNNLAVLMLKQGKKADALSLLKTVDLNSVATEQRPLYAYNLGRTLELNGDPGSAFDQYSLALRLNPKFTEAGTAAFRVLEQMSTPRLKDTLTLSEILIANGYSEIASRGLTPLLGKWADEPDSQRMLGLLIRCYTLQRITPDRFKKEDEEFLQNVEARSPVLRRAIADVRTAYEGKLPVEPTPYPTALFSWTEGNWKLDDIGPLLMLIGDWYSSQKDPLSALGRYSTAWTLTRDPQYALAFASTVRREPLLAANKDQLVSKLVESMFMYKGEQYRKLDWPNILRMHIALGTIFEDEKRWGGLNDYHSAIFQWSNAIKAESEIRRITPQSPPSPGLHFHLADCLAGAGHRDEAAQEYLIAAELYAKAQDGQAAKEALAKVTVAGTDTGNYAGRIHAVQREIEHLEGPA